MKKPPLVVAIAGPTATGKSEIAYTLAKMINGEIISCDSMQIYTSMPILTNAVPKEHRKKIPHHFIEVLTPNKDYNAARYQTQARAAIKGIVKKGKIPVIVGGTGLYLRAVIEGIFKGPSADERLRKKLYAQAEKYGNTYLYKRLQKIDPLAAKKIHPHDLRRVIRALEVFEATGKTISELKTQVVSLEDELGVKVKIFALDVPRVLLYKRIEQRTARMFKQGLLREARRAFKKYRFSKPARMMLGYRQLKEFLKGRYEAPNFNTRSKISSTFSSQKSGVRLTHLKNALALATAHYARRQLIWFRQKKEITWLHLEGTESAATVAKRIKRVLSAG